MYFILFLTAQKYELFLTTAKYLLIIYKQPEKNFIYAVSGWLRAWGTNKKVGVQLKVVLPLIQ